MTPLVSGGCPIPPRALIPIPGKEARRVHPHPADVAAHGAQHGLRAGLPVVHLQGEAGGLEQLGERRLPGVGVRLGRPGRGRGGGGAREQLQQQRQQRQQRQQGRPGRHGEGEGEAGGATAAAPTDAPTRDPTDRPAAAADTAARVAPGAAAGTGQWARAARVCAVLVDAGARGLGAWTALSPWGWGAGSGAPTEPESSLGTD